MNDPATALVYLARGVDGGLASASAFFDSYRCHPAGLPHQLYVIAKAWPDRAAYQELMKLSADAGGKVIDLPDDGFDLTAYYRLACDLREERICFLNTFSVITTDNWLKQLTDALALSGVGLVGCFGSYGTLRPRLKNILFNTLETARAKPLKAALGDLVSYTRDYWCGRQVGYHFPAFPNPHVRTNAFLLDRATYLAFWQGKAIPQTKLAVCALESGSDGLTRFIEAGSRRAVVVGADGSVYQKDKWPESRTFRVPSQSNNMVADNATQRYLSESREYRRKKEFAAWGKCFTA